MQPPWWHRLPVIAAAKTATCCGAVAAGLNGRLLTTAQPSNIPPLTPKTTSLQLPNSNTSTTTLSSSSCSSSSSSSYSVAVSVLVSTPPIRATPELGLVSLLFVLSTAFIALISLAVISIPTMNAFRRLEASANQLSDIVSQEVPGTLFSLKLSGLDIHELTQQLAILREKISARRYANKKQKH
ncbi:uncharacterized protein LOC107433310 [Ziziphus jujuba]|uniref:Uncharacterized protein LOC107433310 n=1 Tax=Ziziphus jujuba TaxID=326968 RepID=A0A6P4AP66_ZIZJJ|nr:uncharacterized protein LOC107433310 [Ziziphus jujuba]